MTPKESVEQFHDTHGSAQNEYPLRAPLKDAEAANLAQAPPRKVTRGRL